MVMKIKDIKQKENVKMQLYKVFDVEYGIFDKCI